MCAGSISFLCCADDGWVGGDRSLPSPPPCLQARQLFSVEPLQGTVDPNKEVTAQVTFNKQHNLDHEVHVANAADVSLTTIEPLTTNKVRNKE